jgi:hypothetical protein
MKISPLKGDLWLSKNDVNALRTSCWDRELRERERGFFLKMNK